MKWGPCTVLLAACVAFFFSVTAHSRPSDVDLLPRNGMPARPLLNGCQELTRTTVDFAGSGVPYQVEWWRCGAKAPNWKKGYFPVHYIVVRPPSGKLEDPGITITNSGNSDLYFIDELEAVKPGAGSRQRLLVLGRYYQTRKEKTECLLGLGDDGFDCEASIETVDPAAQRLPQHEKSLLRRLDDFFTGP